MVVARKSPEGSFDAQLAWSTLERAIGLPEDQRTRVLEDDSLDPGTRGFVEDILRRPPPRELPDIHARYRLLARLGEGGFGEVFLGRSTRPPKRLAAVKVLRHGLAGERILRRFEAEQQALARLDHPAIAGIFESGTTDDGRPFFAMPLAIGKPITRYARDAGLAIPQRVELFRILLDAVAHAHRRGVLHRDLKPANVIVGDGEQGPELAVIDFGIAKSLDEPLSEHSIHTEAGAVVGTPEYMSPEQAEGLPEAADVRSDIYALGAILYELLCGHRPIDRETLRRGGTRRIGETIRNTLVAAPGRRCALQGHARDARILAGDLDAVCMKALAKEQTQRYAGADAMLADLDRWLAGEPVHARSHTWRDNLRVALRRHRTAVAVAASVALALAVGLASTAAFAVQAARESEARRSQADRAANLADFLAGIFAGLDPEQARGRDTTLLRIMLDDAAEQLQRDQPELPPDVAAEIHLVLGTAYAKLIVIEPARFHLDSARDAALDAAADLDEALEIDVLCEWLKLSAYSGASMPPAEIVETANRLLDRHGWPSDPEARMPSEVVESLSALAFAPGGYSLGSEGVEACENRRPCRSILLERLLAFAESRFGADTEVSIGIRSGLGRAYELEGEVEAAHRLLLETLEDAETVLGRRHPITLSTVVKLQIAASKVPGESTDYGAWLPDFEAAYPGSHPRLAAVRYNHACSLRRDGRTSEAIPLFEAAYDAAQENLGLLNDLTLWYLDGFLNALRTMGDAAASERRIVEVFEAYAETEDEEIAARLPDPSRLHRLATWFERWQERPPAFPARVLADRRLFGGPDSSRSATPSTAPD